MSDRSEMPRSKRPDVDRSSLSPEEIGRWRREITVIGFAAVVFVVLALLEVRLPRFGETPSGASGLSFFLLINLNLILLLLLIFLVTRNVVQLVFERRRRVVGARLRSRLVVAFIGLTIVPSLLLFFVAQGFLSGAIDTWLGGHVESAMQASRRVAERYYQETGDRMLHLSGNLADEVVARRLLRSPRQLQRLVDEKWAEWNVDAVEVIIGENLLASAGGSDARLDLAVEGLPAPLRDGSLFARTEERDDRDIVRGGVPIVGRDGTSLGAVVLSQWVPRSIARSAVHSVRSWEDFRQLDILKQTIKNGYALSFLLVTLVVIFAASWFAMHLAKGITEPIQRLGEGMREVAQGNWDYHAEPVGDPEIAALMDSFNGMTHELKEIHSELEDRHRYIQNVLAHVTAGVLSISPDGTVSTVNHAAGAILGVRPGQVEGRRWREVFSGEDQQAITELIAEVLREGAEKSERQIRLGEGRRPMTVWVTVTTIRDGRGTPNGIVVFFEDLTQLLRVERMEAWREVARRIAHEIKNPLTPIQLSAQRIRKRLQGVLPEEDGRVVEECTRTIAGQVDALKRLVSEFSDFARLPTVEVAPADLNALLEETLILYREGHPDIEFRLDFAADLPRIEIDAEAIKRAVINLLDNAVAACQDGRGGKIDVKTVFDTGSGVVRLEVADDGVGMAPDVKVRAFEPYFSSKKGGTGLGLAIVSAVVADHRAYVRLLDNQPQGTRVVIEFPLRRSELLRAAASA